MATPNIRFKGFTDDWEQRKLGEICERVTRKNKNGESDLPLTIASQYGLIDQRDFFNKVVAAKDMSNYYLLKKGEFAYNKSYSNGFDYGSIKRLNAYEQGCLSTLYICFGITSDDVESDYLECYFDTLKWYEDVSQICAEGARNHGLLNVDTKAFFDEVTIEMPSSKEEQRKISAYLNNLDNLITLHQRKCDDTKKIKKYLLSKMFPKNGSKIPEIRFKGFTDDWEQRKLEAVVDSVDTGKSKFDKEGSSGEYPILGSTSVIGYDDEYDYEGDFILTARVGANAGSLYRHAGKVKISDNTVFIQASKNIEFLYHLLTQFDIKKLSFGTGQPLVKASELKNLELMMPTDINEQMKIGEYFKQLDNLITLHQRKCDVLKELKKYMLQNMFPQKG